MIALKDIAWELGPILTYLAGPTPLYIIGRAACTRVLSLENCLCLDYLDWDYLLTQKPGLPTMVSPTLFSKVI